MTYVKALRSSEGFLISLFQFRKNIFVCRTKCILIDLIHCDPTNVIVFQFFWLTIIQKRVKQCQIDGQVRVFVDQFHKYVADTNRNT